MPLLREVPLADYGHGWRLRDPRGRLRLDVRRRRACSTDGAINHPATARLLQRISHTSAVLDAACGTGVDAAALARRGFTVWAADGSEAMAGRRLPGSGESGWRSRLAQHWADLPAATGERFDVVLCVGNSLVHAAGRDAMVQALTGLRRMARPGDTW